MSKIKPKARTMKRTKRPPHQLRLPSENTTSKKPSMSKDQNYRKETVDNLTGEELMDMFEEEDLDDMVDGSKNWKNQECEEGIDVDVDDYLVKRAEREDKMVELLPTKDQSGTLSYSKIEAPIKEKTGKRSRRRKKEASLPASVVEMYYQRERKLQEKKMRIATLCNSALEDPELKENQLEKLMKLMKNSEPDVMYTVKKLVTLSMKEVLQDILPIFYIKHGKPGKGKLSKKETRQLQKREQYLLNSYKSYLQILEKNMAALSQPPKNNDDSHSVLRYRLGFLSLQCMCAMLMSHTNFNYSLNIVHALTPLLNSHQCEVRTEVLKTLEEILQKDMRGEVTFQIVKSVNRLVRSKNMNVYEDVVKVLLHLRIADIDLEKEKDEEIRRKNLMNHQEKLLLMSVKERKRLRRTEKIRKELYIVEAEENKQVKHRHLANSVKMVFALYFRVLKDPKNPKLLPTVLEGLGKYAHLINIEFFHDLVVVLQGLVDDGKLGPRDCLHCVQAVFAILSGQGQSLTIDPIQFYCYLYQNLLHIHTGSSMNDLPIAIKCLQNDLLKRRKKVSVQRALAFTKRLSTLCLQLSHGGVLSILAVIRNVLRSHPSTSRLLEIDTQSGHGVFIPELPHPEHCCADSTSLWELPVLQRHYHPGVQGYTRNISAGGEPVTQGGQLLDMIKKNPQELLTDFDIQTMSFNPSIPPPPENIVIPRAKPKKITFLSQDFDSLVYSHLQNVSPTSSDFWTDIHK